VSDKAAAFAALAARLGIEAQAVACVGVTLRASN
jgi:hypothetical protein